MMTRVRFLQDVADDRAGEEKPIDEKRARRLARTGYVQLLDDAETAIAPLGEQTTKPRPPAKGPRPERRG